MNTRFTSVVKLKKSAMQRSEQVVQKANVDLRSATDALELSYNSLGDISMPSNGTMGEMLASRALFESQRDLIRHNQEWVEFATNQLNQAKERLKLDMIEFEKYKYLELQDIKKAIKKQKIQELRDLDEVAQMTFVNKADKKESI